MAKKTKTPERRPVKAKGTLPAPRVAPKRSRIIWYKRRAIQVVGGVALAALLAAGIWMFLDARGKDRDRRRAVERFERAVNSAAASVSEIVGKMNSVPGELASGAKSPDEYRAEADGWIEALREFDSRMRERDVTLELSEARALYVHGAVLFLDAAKTLRLAADVSGEAREEVLSRGRDLLAHATSAVSIAQQVLAKVKLAVGLDVPTPEGGLPQEFPLTPEKAPPPQPPQPPGGGLPLPGP